MNEEVGGRPQLLPLFAVATQCSATDRDDGERIERSLTNADRRAELGRTLPRPDWNSIIAGVMSTPPIESAEASPAALAARLLEIVRPFRRPIIAFSGGVDSAVVAAAAARACERPVAVTAVSPSLATGELDEARQVANVIGIRLELVRTDEFSRRGYQQNAGNRCYFCKTELYEQLEAIAPSLKADVVLNGANLDDLGDHRPGLVAATEHSVRSPLLEAGLRKADVRAIARLWNIPIWDKPASPCLSSRIAYGVEATPERVRRIDQAEGFLKSLLGIRVLRVRCEAGDLARIEVPLDSLPVILEESTRGRVVAKLREIGFHRVTIDLEGFRSGSLNDRLPIVELTTSALGS